MEIKDMVKIEWSDEPVLTTNQLADSLKCKTDAIANNFNRNKEYFVEGEHYFCLTGEALRQFKREASKRGAAQVPFNVRLLYLWTHKGCVHHCKSINTPAAWRMFNELERVYFGILEGEITMPAEIEKPVAETCKEEPMVAQVDKAELLTRIKKQFAKPCAEFAIVYVLLLSNLIVKIGYTTNPTERFKKIRAETKLDIIDFHSSRLMSLDEARAKEAALKEKYAADCLGGEYFDVRFRDICQEI